MKENENMIRLMDWISTLDEGIVKIRVLERAPQHDSLRMRREV